MSVCNNKMTAQILDILNSLHEWFVPNLVVYAHIHKDYFILLISF